MIGAKDNSDELWWADFYHSWRDPALYCMQQQAAFLAQNTFLKPRRYCPPHWPSLVNYQQTKHSVEICDLFWTIIKPFYVLCEVVCTWMGNFWYHWLCNLCSFKRPQNIHVAISNTAPQTNNNPQSEWLASLQQRWFVREDVNHVYRPPFIWPFYTALTSCWEILLGLPQEMMIAPHC